MSIASNWLNVSSRTSCLMPGDQKLAISAHRPNNLPFLTEAFLKISAFKSILRKADRMEGKQTPYSFQIVARGKVCLMRGSSLTRPLTFPFSGLILLMDLLAFSLRTLPFFDNVLGNIGQDKVRSGTQNFTKKLQENNSSQKKDFHK